MQKIMRLRVMLAEKVLSSSITIDVNAKLAASKSPKGV
jgi:hypothetical protein